MYHSFKCIFLNWRLYLKQTAARQLKEWEQAHAQSLENNMQDKKRWEKERSELENRKKKKS
jgi:hypothetical protein